MIMARKASCGQHLHREGQRQQLQLLCMRPMSARAISTSMSSTITGMARRSPVENMEDPRCKHGFRGREFEDKGSRRNKRSGCGEAAQDLAVQAQREHQQPGGELR